MVIRAVVFDIGGVLEITPDLGVGPRWEARLGLPAGALSGRLHDVWSDGSLGTITEADVHQALKDRLGLDEQQLNAFMAGLWREYLGTANAELIEYARQLRPRYRTGIVSNSFVGAREREQAVYGFEDVVDDIIYSHEVAVRQGVVTPAHHVGFVTRGHARQPASPPGAGPRIGGTCGTIAAMDGGADYSSVSPRTRIFSSPVRYRWALNSMR